MIDYPFSMQNIAVVSNIAQATWDQETIQEISQGKITIPEQTVNDFLQNQDYSSSEIKGIAVSSHEEWRCREFCLLSSMKRAVL